MGRRDKAAENTPDGGFDSELDKVLSAPMTPLLSPLHVLARARIFGGVLDMKLARGESPARSALLAERARLLAEPFRRARLAQSWAELVVSAHEVDVAPMWPRNGLDARVPINKSMVRRSELDIEMLGRALVGRVVAIRGVALAQVLLCDGSGPVYNPNSGFRLSDLIADVVSYLDPLFGGAGPVVWLR
jgi:hypothetical protein